MENKVKINLKQAVERIEKLEGEKREISQHISEIYKELKESGFETKIIKKIVAIRKIDEGE